MATVPYPKSITTVDVAIAVAAELNAPSDGTVWPDIARGFVCSKKWLPKYTDNDLTTAMQLAVMPGVEKLGIHQHTRIARNIVQRTHVISILGQKKVRSVPADQETDVDACVNFLYQLKDYFMAKGRRLSTLANVYCMEALVSVPYSPVDLDASSLWAGTLEIWFMERTQQ